MSADNWTQCPRCVLRVAEEQEKAVHAAAAAYGKVPASEYERLLALSRVTTDVYDQPQTFREDYEFYGVLDGEITASYSGHCQTCGLGVDFKHTVKFFPES